MNIQDPISNFINIIKNGYFAKKDHVIVSKSKIKQVLLQILENKKFIKHYEEFKINKVTYIKIYLLYINDKPVINKIYRVSKNSCRKFLKSTQIPSILNGYGESIISTSHGLITGKEAKKRNIGGELICIIE